jgi:hypothetical protein
LLRHVQLLPAELVKQPEARAAILDVTHPVFQEEQFMAEHIVAMFSTEGAAAAAARDLENVGFSVAGRTLAPLRGLAMSIEELLRRGDGNWSLGIAG